MSAHNWQRVSPWALLYFVIHFAIRFVKDGILNLLPIAVVFATQVERKLLWASVGLAAALVFLIVYAIAYYANFMFCVSDGNQILLNKGVFKKERITLSFERVQNVNISEPFYLKPFKLVNCMFDAAGSSAKEVVIPGVTLTYAEQIRERVLRFKRVHHNELETTEQQKGRETAEALLTIPNSDIAKLGLMSNMALLALAALAPFVNVIFDFLESTFINKLEQVLSEQAELASSAAAIAIIIVVTLVLLIAILLSVAMALVRFFNYRLYYENDKFKRVAGLFERQQLSVSVSKIQNIVIKQNLMSRLLQRYTVQCPQVSSGPVAYAGHKDKQNLVMPVLTKQQLNQITALLCPWFDFAAIEFYRPARALLYKNLMLYMLLPSLITAAVCWLNWQLIWPCFIALPLTLLVFLRFYRLGYCYVNYQGGHYAVFRSGLFGFQYRLFELYKTQSTTTTSTYFMRKAKLKTLYIQLASGSVTMPFINQDRAESFVDHALYQAEKDSRQWF